MMNFRIVKDKLVEILGDAAHGRYRVYGYQKQNKSSDEILNNDRSVQVYFSEGLFPKNKGSFVGEKSHEMTFEIDLSVSASSSGDLEILESDLTTANQKSIALSGIREASEIVDKKLDELIEIVFQVLLDARKTDLDLGNGIIASRWINHIQKDPVLNSGDLVVKTANLKYTCLTVEQITGDTGNEPDSVVFNNEIEVNESAGAGVLVENNNT